MQGRLQTIADGGPLPPHPNMDSAAKTNMEDIEPVLVQRSLDFIDRSVKADKPFFLWHNSTRCHVGTHLSPKWKGKSYADGMVELDWEVGELLKKVDDRQHHLPLPRPDGMVWIPGGEFSMGSEGMCDGKSCCCLSVLLEVRPALVRVHNGEGARPAVE